jgi:hypothetical protein
VNLINSNTPVDISNAEYTYFYLGMTEGNTGGEYGYLFTVDGCLDTLDITVHEAVDMDGPWAPIVEELAVPVADLNWSRGDVMWGAVVRLGVKKSTAGTTTARVKGVAK